MKSKMLKRISKTWKQNELQQSKSNQKFGKPIFTDFNKSPISQIYAMLRMLSCQEIFNQQGTLPSVVSTDTGSRVNLITAQNLMYKKRNVRLNICRLI
mmetsp:Transcript_32744/g.49350  ORF Transcript_32744/g.49350 Transcript_32744/m.49350 type:complete len:98 (-) Transcript_32744:120-413(-)